MADFECVPQNNWEDAEYQPRLLPAKIPWSCDCRKPLFVDPSTICSICCHLEKSFWMGSGQRTLTQIRSAAGADCSVCSIIYRGLIEYQNSWSNVDERNLIVWLDVWLNNALYVQVEDVTARPPVGQATALPEDGKGSAVLWLEYYTLPDAPSPWPTFATATHVQKDPLSTKCKEALQQWIFECRLKHSKCKTRRRVQPLQPPKRLIRIQSSPQSCCGQLQTTEDKKYRYIALSYCWGESTMPKLTKDTKVQRERKIVVSELPKTLQDAFKICQWLNVKYLWIDALCIVQDDENDWNAEALRMAEIYEGAYLTIAATVSADCNDGIVFERETSKEVIGVHPCEKTYSVYVRQRLGHLPIFAGSARKDFPVFERGWCFQERLMARRTLHFTRNELVFECAESVRCECSQALLHGYKRRLKSKLPCTGQGIINETEDTIPREASYSLWQKLVHSYSAKKLTKDGDILIALSGIASRLSPVYGGQYLAGLWEYSLPISLLWESGPSCRRPAQYTAPSFSWASRLGYIRRFHNLSEHEQVDCSVVQVDCVPCNNAAFGPVSSGFVKLRGRLSRCMFYELGTGAPSLPGAGKEARIQYGQEKCKFTFDTDDGGCAFGEELHCFQVCSWPDVRYHVDAHGVRFPPWDPQSEDARSATWYSHALVLRRAIKPYGAYQRVGVSYRVPKSWFGGSDEDTVTIV